MAVTGSTPGYQSNWLHVVRALLADRDQPASLDWIHAQLVQLGWTLVTRDDLLLAMRRDWRWFEGTDDGWRRRATCQVCRSQHRTEAEAARCLERWAMPEVATEPSAGARAAAKRGQSTPVPIEQVRDVLP